MDFNKTTDELITYLTRETSLHKTMRRLSDRELAAIRQTIYHTLERAYLAGYEVGYEVGQNGDVSDAD